MYILSRLPQHIVGPHFVETAPLKVAQVAQSLPQEKVPQPQKLSGDYTFLEKWVKNRLFNIWLANVCSKADVTVHRSISTLTPKYKVKITQYRNNPFARPRYIFHMITALQYLDKDDNIIRDTVYCVDNMDMIYPYHMGGFDVREMLQKFTNNEIKDFDWEKIQDWSAYSVMRNVCMEKIPFPLTPRDHVCDKFTTSFSKWGNFRIDTVYSRHHKVGCEPKIFESFCSIYTIDLQCIAMINRNENTITSVYIGGKELSVVPKEMDCENFLHVGERINGHTYEKVYYLDEGYKRLIFERYVGEGFEFSKFYDMYKPVNNSAFYKIKENHKSENITIEFNKNGKNIDSKTDRNIEIKSGDKTISIFICNKKYTDGETINISSSRVTTVKRGDKTVSVSIYDKKNDDSKEYTVDEFNKLLVKHRDKKFNGKIMGYKIATCRYTNNKDVPCLVLLEIPPEALVAQTTENSKCRANKVITRAILPIVDSEYVYDSDVTVATGAIYTTKRFEYKLNHESVVDDFCGDLDQVCVPGIHFFFELNQLVKFDGRILDSKKIIKQVERYSKRIVKIFNLSLE